MSDRIKRAIAIGAVLTVGTFGGNKVAEEMASPGQPDIIDMVIGISVAVCFLLLISFLAYALFKFIEEGF